MAEVGSQLAKSTTERRMSLRALATLLLILVSVASTVQVCHAHDEASFGGTARHALRAAAGGGEQGGSVPENRCPLCVAMHSALPTGLHVAPEPLLQLKTINSVAADAERIFRWRFEMASRPPPVAGIRG